MPAKRNPRPLSRDTVEALLRSLRRDIRDDTQGVVLNSERRIAIRLVGVEKRLIILETQIAALMTEEVLNRHLRRLATNIVRELATQGIRLDAQKLVA